AVFDALKAGARGYLLKAHTAPKQLLVAIKEVVTDGGPMTPSIARKVMASFEVPGQRVNGLSKREREILELLTKGLMYKEIADALAISMNTVRTYLASIYNKLHVRSRTAAAMYFVQHEHG